MRYLPPRFLAYGDLAVINGPALFIKPGASVEDVIVGTGQIPFAVTVPAFLGMLQRQTSSWTGLVVNGIEFIPDVDSIYSLDRETIIPGSLLFVGNALALAFEAGSRAFSTTGYAQLLEEPVPENTFPRIAFSRWCIGVRDEGELTIVREFDVAPEDES